MFDHILIQSSCTGDDGQWILGRTKSHRILHSVHKSQILCFIPPSLICLHEDIHETFGRIEDVLESAVGIRGFVGVSSDRITLVQCHEWQDFVLKIFPCCSMAD